jgi:predicted phosphodiesterase
MKHYAGVAGAFWVLFLPMRIAVVSDIHGNRWALESVLKDIARRGITDIVNLGDCVYGPLDPVETLQMLREFSAVTVRGNEDRLIAEPPPGTELSSSIAYARECLSEADIRWLKYLPTTAIAFGELFLFHGTPEKDDAYLLRTVEPSGVKMIDVEHLDTSLAAINQSVVLCGHDHIPSTRRLPGGKLLLNPGSVGLQAYTDDLPYPHAMQTGSPHARYAILSRTIEGWQSEDVRVAYDWEAAARLAETNSRPDWALWLRTGRAAVSLKGLR